MAEDPAEALKHFTPMPGSSQPVQAAPGVFASAPLTLATADRVAEE